MKQVGIYPCACACHGDSPSLQNERPSMAELHSLLQNHKWAEIQEAITKDKSVSMRIDDSLEEDIWFDEARRRKAAMEDIDIASISNNIVSDDAAKQDTHAQEQDENEEDTLQLRYWAQPNNNANLFNIDSQTRLLPEMIPRCTF